MKTLVIGQSEVRRLLPMERCIELVGEALGSLTRGEAVNPLRTMLRVPDGRGILGLMPGYVASPEALGLKVVGVFHGNQETVYDSHPGIVLLCDPQHGVPVAVIDASEITAIRTAAVSALATRLLARGDAGDLALFGSGVQARTHLAAMRVVRRIRRVRVYSPTVKNREAFARRESERHGIDVEPVGTAREAADGSDILCTVTSSHDPVLFGEWIAPGAHVNAVGASTPTARELDTKAVASSRLFVDRRESTLNEAGDFLIARKEGAIGDEHIRGELGELLLGRVAGRRRAEERTLFKSLGLAVEDLAVAHEVYRQALSSGSGTSVELGGMRDAPA